MGARQSVQTQTSSATTAAAAAESHHNHNRRTISTNTAGTNGSLAERRGLGGQRTYSLPGAPGTPSSSSGLLDMFSRSSAARRSGGGGTTASSRQSMANTSSAVEQQQQDSDSSDEVIDVQRVLQLPSFRLNIPRFRQSRSIVSAAQGASSSQRRSLHVFPFFDIKCPVCNKIVPSDEAETHLVMCLTRPRITYNDDVLSEDKGECVICFDEMVKGDPIARLPCLCIYHKKCIDLWFKKKNCCPAHPGDE